MARIPSRPGVEVSERVREAIRADIETANYADGIDVEAEGRVVVLRGRVSDLQDADSLVAVARDVTDVNDVVDQLEVVGLD
jgi:osmotically-inducible protein OsmY